MTVALTTHCFICDLPCIHQIVVLDGPWEEFVLENPNDQYEGNEMCQECLEEYIMANDTGLAKEEKRV